MLRFRSLAAGGIFLALCAGAAGADEVKTTIHRISAAGIGAPIGTITLKDTDRGMMIVPDLRDLQPGKHAFHIHQNPDCGPDEKNGKMTAGLRAGAHYHPAGVAPASNNHAHMKHGHAAKPHGDLPELVVTQAGTATAPVITDKLMVAEVRGRSIMVHRYGETGPDNIKGGGPRIACGVIPR